MGAGWIFAKIYTCNKTKAYFCSGKSLRADDCLVLLWYLTLLLLHARTFFSHFLCSMSLRLTALFANSTAKAAKADFVSRFSSDNRAYFDYRVLPAINPFGNISLVYWSLVCRPLMAQASAGTYASSFFPLSFKELRNTIPVSLCTIFCSWMTCWCRSLKT